MYDQAAENAATTIRAIMRSKVPRGTKQAEIEALMQSLQPATNANTIRSLLDSYDAVETRVSSGVDELAPLPTGGLCDGEPLIYVCNGMAWVSRCRVNGKLRIDDHGQLLYESLITIEAARNWHVLELDAWFELQSIEVSHVQQGYYPCSPTLFGRATFG